VRRRHYDLFSRFYDRFVAWHSGEPTGPMRRTLAERATCAPVQHALDLCCGTGAVRRALAESALAGTVIVGLDFSRGMLSRGVVAARQAGLTGIRWVQADASALPFKANVFDVVTCAYALYELKGPTRSIMPREVARALSPGG
jgi:demethylmenaquinone methyltransferase/2-methoxy-6-polyprenyl-1,4-benzoquinol methylase